MPLREYRNMILLARKIKIIILRFVKLKASKFVIQRRFEYCSADCLMMYVE